MPNGPTPGALPAAARPVLRAAVLLSLVAGAALATASPAAAAQDPTRPTATVTRGPSCEPGGVEIKVVAGSTPYHVVLATTRRPQGEDAADVPAGATALLHSGDVDWGETIDSRLLYTAQDGSGASYADELDDWTMTRPSYQDCAAISAPASGSGGAPAARTTAPGSAAPSVATAAGSPSGSGTPTGTTAPGSSAPTSRSGGSAPGPASPSGGSDARPSAVVSSGAAGARGAAGHAVGAGRPVTVSGSGFEPGEDVVLRLRGTGAVLAQATAGRDGTVRLAFTVPAHASGATQLDLVGRTSQVTAPLRLQVAALRTAVDDGDRPVSLPALAALLALLGSGGGLVAVSRRAAAARGTAAMRGA